MPPKKPSKSPSPKPPRKPSAARVKQALDAIVDEADREQHEAARREIRPLARKIAAWMEELRDAGLNRQEALDVVLTLISKQDDKPSAFDMQV